MCDVGRARKRQSLAVLKAALPSVASLGDVFESIFVLTDEIPSPADQIQRARGFLEPHSFGLFDAVRAFLRGGAHLGTQPIGLVHAVRPRRTGGGYGRRRVVCSGAADGGAGPVVSEGDLNAHQWERRAAPASSNKLSANSVLRRTFFPRGGERACSLCSAPTSCWCVLTCMWPGVARHRSLTRCSSLRWRPVTAAPDALMAHLAPLTAQHLRTCDGARIKLSLLRALAAIDP